MFCSLLYEQPQALEPDPREPACFRDLNLDQLIRPILQREDSPELTAAYRTPLCTPEQVRYRQEILRDLMPEGNRAAFEQVSRELRDLERLNVQALEDLHSGDPWRCHPLLYGHFLDHWQRYCRAVEGLLEQMPAMNLRSEGLLRMQAELEAYCGSGCYRELRRTQKDLRERFDREEYCMLIRNGTVRVKKYEGEENLSEQILRVFQKFRRETGTDYRQNLREIPHSQHVEAEVLQCLSRVYPELFGALRDAVGNHSEYLDPGLLRLCRELRFYLSWLDEIRELRDCGLPFCFPKIGTGETDTYCNGGYDLVLAKKLREKTVRNDLLLRGPERILVVTGPNQGGKTTYARTIGQLYYLSSLGLCVPGESAQLHLPDHILTHFEQEESEQSPGGKLQDDLKRLHDLLQQTTDRSVVIVNEIFASTVPEDALKLGTHMMDALREKGALAVVVTFLGELARSGPETVSMKSTVDPRNPERRTFRVVRQPPDGQAYAQTLAQRHGLSYEQILRRIEP